MLEYAKQSAFIYFTTRSLVANVYKKHQFPRLVYYVKSTISIKCWSWCHILHLYCLPREGDDPVVPGLPRDPLPHHLLHLLLAGVHQAEGCDVCSTVFEIFKLHHVQVLTGKNWQKKWKSGFSHQPQKVLKVGQVWSLNIETNHQNSIPQPQ